MVRVEINGTDVSYYIGWKCEQSKRGNFCPCRILPLKSGMVHIPYERFLEIIRRDPARLNSDSLCGLARPDYLQ